MVLHRAFRARHVRKTGIGGEVRHGVTSDVSCETSLNKHSTPDLHREYLSISKVAGLGVHDVRSGVAGRCRRCRPSRADAHVHGYRRSLDVVFVCLFTERLSIGKAHWIVIVVVHRRSLDRKRNNQDHGLGRLCQVVGRAA